MARLSLAAVAQEVETIKGEIETMKQTAVKEAHDIKVKLTELETTSREILGVVQSAKTLSRYARRWAGPVIASAATAGFFNPKFTTFITSLLG